MKMPKNLILRDCGISHLFLYEILYPETKLRTQNFEIWNLNPSMHKISDLVEKCFSCMPCMGHSRCNLPRVAP
jgi:hypothetical protein